MATYDPTLASARDRLRFALGDTNVAAPLEADTTYDAAIAWHGEAGALRAMAEGLASRFAQKPDRISDGDFSVSWGERVKAWRALVSGSGAPGTAGTVQATRGDEVTSEYVRTWWTT